MGDDWLLFSGQVPRMRISTCLRGYVKSLCKTKKPDKARCGICACSRIHVEFHCLYEFSCLQKIYAFILSTFMFTHICFGICFKRRTAYVNIPVSNTQAPDGTQVFNFGANQLNTSTNVVINP